MLPISLEPIPISQFEESVLEKEEDSQIFNQFRFDQVYARRKGTRECTKRPLYPLSHFVSFQRFSFNHKSFLSTLSIIPIPNSLFEALSKTEWRLTMEAEMDALQKNETWEWVDLPSGLKVGVYSKI